MPIYVYECQECKAEIEKIQKFSDPPLKECEYCGGPLEKVIKPPAIHFKGTGWYVTDYARKEKGRSGDEKPKTQDKGDGSESGT